MSAFVCDPEHFKALARFAVRRHHGSMNVDPRYLDSKDGDALFTRPEEVIATFYANTLYQENVRSVQARYPSDSFEELPGLINKPVNILVRFNDLHDPRKPILPAVAILKMCQCLNYQSCETEDWETTLAFKILDHIKTAAIHNLPGYEDAPWEYTP
jgi:hypothetical protein